MKRLAILGSTGSIGRAALEVAEHLGDVEVIGICANSDYRVLSEQARRWRPRVVAVAHEPAARELRPLLPDGVALLAGPDAASELAAMPGIDLVLVAVVGSAGLRPTLAALEAGRDVALSNKEALVAGGHLVAAARERGRARLLPVDSEHSAIAQCLLGEDPGSVRRLILTASGGPFLDRPVADLRAVTVLEALAHPTWNMGRKITIDSATLMNKGLEVIEAHWLFGTPAERIDVVIHPQSLVHSMVEFQDGSTIAQLGRPDMRGPIQHALTGMIRRGSLVAPMEWGGVEMSFRVPERERFPALWLARAALEQGGTAPAALNAANEVAVSRFLDGRLAFPAIAEVVEAVLDRHRPVPLPSLEEVLGADAWARSRAEEIVGGMR